MFGVVRPCRHRMSGALRRAWQAHLCGLCLTLRDTHGQAARLVTSYDTLLVSVLTEAQNPRGSPHRTAGPCPLRGLRRADVVAASAPGAQLAASVSLVLAAVKITDHVADADGLTARRPVAAAASRVAARWAEQGAATGAAIGFDSQVCTGAAGRQSQLESAAAPSLLAVTEPAETAVAAAFAHTATLAAKPHNAPALARAGRMFGRIAHLLDAVEDFDADRRSGRYNPCWPPAPPQPGRGRTATRRCWACAWLWPAWTSPTGRWPRRCWSPRSAGRLTGSSPTPAPVTAIQTNHPHRLTTSRSNHPHRPMPRRRTACPGRTSVAVAATSAAHAEPGPSAGVRRTPPRQGHHLKHRRGQPRHQPGASRPRASKDPQLLYHFVPVSAPRHSSPKNTARYQKSFFLAQCFKVGRRGRRARRGLLSWPRWPRTPAVPGRGRQQPGKRRQEHLAEHGRRPDAAVGRDELAVPDQGGQQRPGCRAEELPTSAPSQPGPQEPGTDTDHPCIKRYGRR